jgi:ataxia telangiectasia mutated family protein
MGITGVEGTFRKCCEEVLRVLRVNTSLLLTILDVVIHDPFYKWRLSPKQVRQRQHEIPIQGDHVPISDEIGEQRTFERDAAHRTIIRMKNKLQGYDESAGEGLSVEGQVEILINDAQNLENLCKIFPGWAPWL